jgi:dienelactone hydrolase
MAALWAMSERMLKQVRLSASDGFCAALAFYPGCSRLVQEQPDYRPYAPILMLLAGQDEEVNPRTCETFGQQVHVNSNGSQFQLYTYPGAEHSFDHPDKAGHHNAFARDDAKRRAATFMEQYVRRAYSSSVSPSD